MRGENKFPHLPRGANQYLARQVLTSVPLLSGVANDFVFFPTAQGAALALADVRNRGAAANEAGGEEGSEAAGRIMPPVEVVEEDSLRAAERIHAALVAAGEPVVKRARICGEELTVPRIALLVMASATRIGGGFLNGAAAQEEEMCRRTTLFPALQEAFRARMVPLPRFGGVVSRPVFVLRDDCACGKSRWRGGARELRRATEPFAGVRLAGGGSDDGEPGLARFASLADALTDDGKMCTARKGEAYKSLQDVDIPERCANGHHDEMFAQAEKSVLTDCSAESGAAFERPAFPEAVDDADVAGEGIFPVAMVNVAAINAPKLDTARRFVDVEAARGKVAGLLAACRPYDYLVLGALGCGAFRNPPDHQAELFREALQGTPFVGVTFAILGGKNLASFKRVLDPQG